MIQKAHDAEVYLNQRRGGFLIQKWKYFVIKYFAIRVQHIMKSVRIVGKALESKRII